MEISLFCLQYLAAPAFNLNQGQNSVKSTALTGFYGLQDYAFAHWDTHLARIATQRDSDVEIDDSVLTQRLSTTWNRFSERYASVDGEDVRDTPGRHIPAENSPNESTAVLETDQQIPTKPSWWQAVSRSRQLEETITFVRRTMYSMDQATLTDKERQTYVSLNGPKQFKCPRRYCHRFESGFYDASSLTEHISQHERNFLCPHKWCYAWQSGFPSSSTLQAHIQRVHPVATEDKTMFPSSSEKKPRDLVEACKRGDMVAVQGFVREGAVQKSINDEPHRLPPIIAAARKGHIAVCQYLSKYGEDAYSTRWPKRPGFTALGEAIRHEDRDLFLALVSEATGSRRDEFINNATGLVNHILLALKAKEGWFLETLLSWNDLRSSKITFGHILLQFVKTMSKRLPGQDRLQEMMERAFAARSYENGASVGDSPTTSKHTEDVGKWLCYTLTRGGSPSTSVLHQAVLMHNEAAVFFLLKNLSPEDALSLGEPLLLFALQPRRRPASYEVVQKIIDHSGVMNISDEQGKSLVYLICNPEISPEVFSLVFRFCRTAINDADEAGMTPLHILARKGYSDASRTKMGVLLDTGDVDLLRRDRKGRTAFAIAAEWSDKRTMELLYSANSGLATMRDDTDEAWCPLHHAIHSLDEENVEYLLTLPEAEALMEMCRPDLGGCRPYPLYTLLLGSIAAQNCGVAKELLLSHKFELEDLRRIEDKLADERLQKPEDPDIPALLHIRRSMRYDKLSPENLVNIRETLSKMWVFGELDFDPVVLEKDLVELASFAVKHGHNDIVEALASLQVPGVIQPDEMPSDWTDGGNVPDVWRVI